MPPSQAIQYFEAPSFVSNTGVTTAAKGRQEPDNLAFERFWCEYYSEVHRKCETEIRRRLEKLTQYPFGWNSYSAPPLRQDTADFALHVLKTIMKRETPFPQIVPSSTGGVQLEWHERGVDLELHIAAPFDCEIWYEDLLAIEKKPISTPLTNDFSIMARPIELLTSRR
jgi:hypothetical protein